jgi:protein-tyrosine kinase
MLIPKASHLVERVAERLLRSGALDESAAQLLRPPGGEAGAEPPGPEAAGHANDPASPVAPSPDVSGAVSPSADARGADAAGSGVPGVSAQQGSALSATLGAPAAAARSQRSSLFAAPPTAKPILPLPGARPASPVGGADAARLGTPVPPGVSANEPGSSPNGVGPSGPGPVASPLASPAILGQPRALGQSAVLDRSADFAGAALPPGQRPGLADPAAGMLQGPASIDAVSLERAGMVDWSRTRTRISEEFRLVQRQIIRSAFGPGAEPGFSNLLLVTSARPGEGKSFMATNLAGSIARQGDHHVLLIDADSKRDSICYSLGLAQARGLLDLAANPKLDPAPLIVKTPIERLSILPVGRERERSAELFSTKEMTRLIQSLGRRYADRLLILDAPPCLSTSDPAVLAQVVGQILFVVEADRTQRDEIEASLDLIQACPTITMVLNKQQISSRYTFGAYSSYYSS